MAHFAQLDENNTVIQVIVVHNNDLVANKQTMVNEDGSISTTVIEAEDKGIEFCQSLYGADTRWVQTSYNGNFRGKYAGIGDVYDADANEFRSPVVANSPDVPVVEPVVETQQTMVLETQAPVGLSSADLPALTSEQISGLE
jgi:hypothetical protein